MDSRFRTISFNGLLEVSSASGASEQP